MNPGVKKLWVDALRSGEYEQGKGYLREGDKFCCLGVLCDIYLKEHPEPHPEAGWREYFGRKTFLNATHYLPPEVVDWALLRGPNPVIRSKDNRLRSITGINDSEWANFEEIANIIEENL